MGGVPGGRGTWEAGLKAWRNLHSGFSWVSTPPVLPRLPWPQSEGRMLWAVVTDISACSAYPQSCCVPQSCIHSSPQPGCEDVTVAMTLGSLCGLFLSAQSLCYPRTTGPESSRRPGFPGWSPFALGLPLLWGLLNLVQQSSGRQGSLGPGADVPQGITDDQYGPTQPDIREVSGVGG